MHGFPKDFDSSRFVGCALESVSFSENTVHLNFGKDVSITIDGRFTHSLAGGDLAWEGSAFHVQESKLMQLNGQSIVFADASSEGTLSLTFSNDQTLRCYDDTPWYEAFHIKFGDEEIHV